LRGENPQPLPLPFDPVARAREVESPVMDGPRRKYYRFRAARYYGGIATADAVGCCLLCAYCWNYGRNLDPACAKGFFVSPKEAAERLLGILRRKRLNKVRVSGAEPVLGRRSFEHLVSVMEIVARREPMADFIVETNGLLFGVHPEFAKELAGFRRVFVRVCLKGWDEESFERITGARGEFFELPVHGLRFLIEAGVVAWPAVMYEVFGAKGMERVSRLLREHGISPEELEVEYLEPYPFVMGNLAERGVKLEAEPVLRRGC